MLESVAWRRVRKEWSQELENKPKLSMLKKIAEYEGLHKAEGRYFTVSNGDRQMAWIEKRGKGMKECDSGEVEDVVHWMIRCPAWIGHCEALLKQCHDHSSNSDEDPRQVSYAWLATATRQQRLSTLCGRRVLARSAGLNSLYPASP